MSLHLALLAIAVSARWAAARTAGEEACTAATCRKTTDSVLLQVERVSLMARLNNTNTELDEASAAVVSRPTNEEWRHYEMVKNLRARGFRCPDGTYFAPYNGPLEWDCRLARAAEGWSRRMATEGFEGHRYGGSTPCQRTEAQGYPRQRGCGENLALGRGEPDVALRQLQESNEHCKNMMNPDYNMIGVGYVYNANSKFRHYWTDSFGSWHQRPDQSCIGGSPAPSPPPGCADQDTLHCQTYKRQGYCQTSENVKRMCKDTCAIGNCGQTAQPSPSPAPSSGACQDTVGSCDYYRSQGYCTISDNVKNGCKKTCGFCSSTPCTDNDGACAYYQANGYCSSDHIRKYCRKSCGQCR